MDHPTTARRLGGLGLLLATLPALAGEPAKDSADPATWNEWLLPLGQYTTAEPQGAACRIFVREVGRGRPIVMLHGGWGGEHESLLRGLLPLADRHRLVFYDQRGSLRSPCDEPPTAARHVDDLELLRATLGEDKVVLLGHSMGGWLAQAYAAAHPAHVAGLILIGSVPARHDLPSRSAETRWERPEVLRELARNGLVLPRRPEDSIQDWSINHRIIFASVGLHDVTRWRSIPVPWFYASDAAAASGASMPQDYDFTASLSALGIPILVLAGDDDYIPVESHEAWTAQVPNARLRVVPDAGHFAWIDRPEVVLAEIRDYVAGLDAADRPAGASAPPAPAPFDGRALLKLHTRELSLRDGRLTGPGLDLILAEAAGARFVLLGEPHNTDEVNLFARALFERLHDDFGFRYLALEQDPLILERYGSPPFRGDLAAIRADVAAGNHNALHFATDGELALLAAVGAYSKATDSPLWGVDRTLGAEVALARLRDALEDAGQIARVSAVLEEARDHNGRLAREVDLESARDRRFMLAESPSLDALLAGLDAAPASPAAWIVEQLRVSRRDLRRYQVEHAADDPWGYVSNLEREELMKHNFARHVRAAEARGETPRVLVKAGHWHVQAGRNQGGVIPLGAALDGAAEIAGEDTFSIAITVVNRPGQHWTITDYDDYELFREIADPDAWKIADLRPLRAYVHAGLLKLPRPAEDYVFGFDAVLLLGGTRTGSYSWAAGR